MSVVCREGADQVVLPLLSELRSLTVETGTETDLTTHSNRRTLNITSPSDAIKMMARLVLVGLSVLHVSAYQYDGWVPAYMDRDGVLRTFRHHQRDQVVSPSSPKKIRLRIKLHKNKTASSSEVGRLSCKYYAFYYSSNHGMPNKTDHYMLRLIYTDFPLTDGDSFCLGERGGAKYNEN